MRIGIVSPYAEPEKGAATIRVNAFRECFEGKGAGVEILAPKRQGVGAAKGVSRYESILELMKRIRSSDFDAVLGTSPPLTHNFFALLACRLSGKKFVLDAKEDPFAFEALPSFFSFKGLKRRAYFVLRKITYKNSDKLFFLTELDREIAKKEFSLADEGLVLVPNGSDSRKVFFDSRQRRKVRKKLKVQKDYKVLIYAGSLGDEDISGFINSASSLNRKKVFLLFVVSHEPGDNSEILNLKELLSAKGFGRESAIIENVPFDGVYRYFSAADIGIVPWKEKMFTSIPVKVFDYLAAGLFIGVKGPSRGSLKRFCEKSSFTGFYSVSWKEFKKKLGSAIQGNQLSAGRSKRIALIREKYSRQRFAARAFREIKELVRIT